MFSVFKKRRTALLAVEGDADPRRNRGRSTSLQLCMQLALVCACVVILFFGLAVTAIGFWGYNSQQDYLTITEKDPELTRLPISMMVTGGFVAILGLVGVLGSLFSRTITGQTLLGVFSFVLVLVIISEVGAGAAAIKLKFKLVALIGDSAELSQKEYISSNITAEKWDKFQKKHACCGAKGYVDGTPPYYNVFDNVSVPLSCCNDGVEHRRRQEGENCEAYTQNATRYHQYIYKKGCSSVAISGLTETVAVIAIVTIAIGTTQLLAVFLAVVVAYMSSKLDGEEKSTSYSYNKLLQEELHQDDTSQPTLT